MDYRRLGNSGIEVSALSLGSWNTFEFMSRDDGLAVMSAAIDGGINFLDDARYDDTSGKAPIKTGYSEVVFGELLRAGGFDRNDLFLSNRMWFEFYPDESFEAEVDASLQRVGVDHFDLVFCFHPPKDLDAAEMVSRLEALIKTGKIRYWAPGNWPAKRIAECCAIAEAAGAPLPPAAMVPYALSIKSFVENPEMETVCRRYDIALVPSFALQGGLLTGKYNAPDVTESTRYRPKHIRFFKESGLLAKVAEFRTIAEEAGYSPDYDADPDSVESKHPLVASVLFGATSARQIEENLTAPVVAESLEDALVERLNGLFPEDVRFGPG